MLGLPPNPHMIGVLAGAAVPANVSAAAAVLICVCIVVAILLCQWSVGQLLCPLYVSSTSTAWTVEVLIDCCHGCVGSLIFILSYLKTCDPGRILPYIEERHIRILIG